ncbi:MAG: SMC family ATPase [Chloroflexota bacterium]
MIPIRLELSNFLSYRQTAVLDFTGIHTACISGANGAGKSSVLDGITWALFGQARSRSDDDLVNRLAALEGKSAEVRFIFQLEGSIYRIIRRKAARKRLMLELQISTDSQAELDKMGWKALSESKVRETQAAIEKLLRMNYTTFINASFLLQGKADEFTTRTPNQRKEILADLLGVSVWDSYREAVTERRKGSELDLKLLDGRLEDIDAELTEEETRKANLAAAKAGFDRIQERLTLQENLLAQVRQTEAAVAQQERAVADGANNLQQAERTLASRRKTQQQRQEERDSYTAILAQAAEIISQFAAWQGVDKELKGWQEKANQYHRLQGEKRPFELAIAQTRSRLEQQQKALQQQSAEVEAAQRDQVRKEAVQTASQARLAELERDIANLTLLEGEWQEARLKLQQIQGERKLLEQEAAQLGRQQRQAKGWVEEQTAVSRNAQTATQRLADLTTKIGQITTQNQRHATALAERDGLNNEQPRLREQMNKIKERLDRLKAESGSTCPLCGQPLSASHRREVLAELEGEGKELGNRFRGNRQRLDGLKQEVGRLEIALKEAPKLEEDQQTQQQRLAKAEARQAELAQALAEWESTGAGRLMEVERLLGDKTAVLSQEKRVAELQTAVAPKATLEKERQTQQRQLSAAEARLGEIERLVTAWQTEGSPKLVEVEQILASGEIEPEAQAKLAGLNEELAALGYDSAAHEAVRQQHKGLQTAGMRHQELQQAEAAVKPLEDTLADLAQQIAEQQGVVTTLMQQQETAVSQLESLKSSLGDRRAIDNEVFQLREEQIAANRRVGAAQQRLGVLDDLREQQSKLQEERVEVTQQIQRLTLLEKACGRNGVQALLIEQALPDIEDRANELLERLTGGSMRVMFETQKKLKSRDAVAETLDIRIQDAAGERPYDNYSGGEQFRVNFAIRLALSQLLAKRAGARLQTLVIDEGFGSQDPNGRQRLIEAINTIQNDFVTILVITHIDELRDAFPSRIEVVKEVSGSQISVS